MNDTDRDRILWALRIAQAVLELRAANDAQNENWPDECGQNDAEAWGELMDRVNAAGELILGGDIPSAAELDDICEEVNR